MGKEERFRSTPEMVKGLCEKEGSRMTWRMNTCDDRSEGGTC